MPNVLGILPHRAVSAEIARAGDVLEALDGKAARIVLVIGIGAQAGFLIAGKVQQQEVMIGAVPAGAIQQRVMQLGQGVILGQMLPSTRASTARRRCSLLL